MQKQLYCDVEVSPCDEKCDVEVLPSNEEL